MESAYDGNRDTYVPDEGSTLNTYSGAATNGQPVSNAHPASHAEESFPVRGVDSAQIAANNGATVSGESQQPAGLVVYIAFERATRNDMTTQSVLGLYTNLAKANEAVQGAFMDEHGECESFSDPCSELTLTVKCRQDSENDDDCRERSYGDDGTLFCSFRVQDSDSHELEFWVEKRFVNEETEGPRTTATNSRFEEAFDDDPESE